jgi:PAS domain S-box-containing protein
MNTERIEASAKPRRRPSAREKLRQSEQNFQLLVSSVKDYAIVMLDPGGRILTWNEGAERLKGYKAAEIVGRSMECLYPAEARAAGKPAHLLAIATATGRVEDEGWRVRKDGSRFFADVIITALHNPDGTLAGFAKVTRDITERRRAEEALAASEARYRLLAENSTDVIMQIAPDATRTYVSPSIRDLTQYQPEELLGGPHGSLVHPNDRAAWSRSFARASDDGISEVTYRMVRKDGSYIWVEATRRRLPDGSFVVSMRDIEARKRMEDELREAKNRAEHANQARVTFFTELSHELRSPLNAVIGFAELIEQQMVGPVGTAAYLEYATDIQSSARHLLGLINDILDHAKAEEGYLELSEAAVEIAEVLAFAVHTLAPRAAAAGVAITSMIAPEIYAVRGDERRLKQIVLNLVGNAVKFTPTGGRVAISAIQTPDGALLLSVADTGAGIADADQERIFQPFTQVKTVQGGEGTGLGLPLTRRLVELHGGVIEIESALGQGTTMTVRLPAERVISGP